MKQVIAVALLCLVAASAHDDGQWRGEGLAESQDHGQYNRVYGGAYGYGGHADDGQWRGEGIAESQDDRGYYGAQDGQWRGEGLAESQDHGQYNQHYAAPYAYAGRYAHGAAPIGHDGRVVDTPEVAHAKAAFFAAYNKASAGGHYAYAPAPVAPYAGHYAPAIAVAAVPYAGHYAHGAAPIGHDGRVVDTPEVAHAKAAHFAAKAAAAHY